MEEAFSFIQRDEESAVLGIGMLFSVMGALRSSAAPRR